MYRYFKPTVIVLTLTILGAAIAMLSTRADATPKDDEMCLGTIDTKWIPPEGCTQYGVDDCEDNSLIISVINNGRGCGGVYSGYKCEEFQSDVEYLNSRSCIWNGTSCENPTPNVRQEKDCRDWKE